MKKQKQKISSVEVGCIKKSVSILPCIIRDLFVQYKYKQEVKIIRITAENKSKETISHIERQRTQGMTLKYRNK